MKNDQRRNSAVRNSASIEDGEWCMMVTEVVNGSWLMLKLMVEDG